MAKFRKGDVVQLLSGGPAMVVDDEEAFGGNVDVKWFAGKKMESARVDPDTLRLFPDGIDDGKTGA